MQDFGASRRCDRQVKGLRIAVFSCLGDGHCRGGSRTSTCTTSKRPRLKRTLLPMPARCWETWQRSMARKIESVDSLATSITSFARYTGAVWPNVTIPDYELRAANTLTTGESASTLFYPIVQDADRSGYEAHMAAEYNTMFDNALGVGVCSAGGVRSALLGPQQCDGECPSTSFARRRR